MASPELAPVREELLDRRQRLESALRAVSDPAPLRGLLRDVDAALERIEDGTYGLCSVCHEAIEADRLAEDALIRNCLDHLTPQEQRALEQDLDLSSRVQAELLPERRLVHRAWEVAYQYEPLGAVSGDYCDVQIGGQEHVLVFVGDAVGKGVAASLLMSHLHAIFRSLVGLAMPLGELVARANRVFCESTGGRRYATLACAAAGDDGRVEVCNAGHCPPLHINGNEISPVPPGGTPLGLFCGTPYATASLRLDAGDTLLLYTDGLSEARGRDGQELGAEGVMRAAQACAGRPPSELVQACIDAMTAHRAGVPRADDVTVLALRRRTS